jgi:hypothetical protein
MNSTALSRAKRQYPYLPLNAVEAIEVRQEAGAVFEGITDLVRLLVQTRFRGSSRHDHEDVRQEVFKHLWAHSLPRFDAHRRPTPKLSTFLCHCAKNHISLIARTLTARSRAFITSHADAAFVVAPDQQHDRQIERLADGILNRPGDYGVSPAVASLMPHIAGHGQRDGPPPGCNPTKFHSYRLRLKHRVLEIAATELQGKQFVRSLTR